MSNSRQRQPTTNAPSSRKTIGTSSTSHDKYLVTDILKKIREKPWKTEFSAGDPVFTMDGRILLNNKLDGGWVVEKVTFKWYADLHRYCESATFFHQDFGTIFMKTRYGALAQFSARNEDAWVYFYNHNHQYIKRFDI